MYENSLLIKEDIIIKEDKVNFNIRNFGKDFRITICKEIKDNTQFYFRNKSKNLLQSQCKQCGHIKNNNYKDYTKWISKSQKTLTF